MSYLYQHASFTSQSSLDRSEEKRDHPDTSPFLGIFFPACDENQNYACRELFAAQCCLYHILDLFSFVIIQGLHIVASTLSDSR
jgi:hypothetical protein